jgi:outer membrane receptor protein involved in Fe transport
MLLGLLLLLGSEQASITGIVVDSSGGAVPGAVVVVQTASGPEEQTVTGPDGRFTLEGAEGDVTLVVRAGGFAVVERAVTGPGDVEIVLSPATLLEEVTVTPARSEQRLGDTPASVHVLSDEDIKTSPALVADDVLRQVPTFSLFRRTSSLASHPTAQGVSLRGIGPSGTSRTLVLVDNVPFNDPFGGWVYWTRVPLDSVDRIEVVDGSSSALYGNYAMGGVINIVSARPARRTAELKVQYGNRNTPKADFFGSDVWGRVGVAVDGSVFDTSGYPIVAEGERGPVDTKAQVEFRNVNGRVDISPTSNVNAFFRAGYFREERDNAKIVTVTGAPAIPEANDTTWKSLSGGARLLLPDTSDLQARLFGDFETFHSNFLAVPNLATRAIGRITLDQRVPTDGFGGMVQWGRGFGLSHHVSAGTDWRWVDGDSIEDAMDAVTGTTIVTKRVSGGSQRSFGVFVQDMFSATPELTVTLGARLDNWRNYDAHNLETTVATGLPTAGHRPSLPDKSDTVVSPRAAALYRFTDRVSAWGAISSGFRAPTLNELYRQFRVGALLTLANDQLGPERLLGGEVGVNIAAARDVTVRATWFDNRVKNPIFNVTRTDLVNTQQRQNLGKTRVRGIQTDVDYRLGESWQFSAGYLFDSAKVSENTANPALVGRFLPQVPEHRASFQVAFTDPRSINVALGVQVLSKQFDDDLNARGVPSSGCLPQSTSCVNPGLPGYAVIDLTAYRTVTRNVEVFAGVQNLLDEEYFVGTNPTTVGSPRLVHGGLRIRFSGQ